MERALKSTPDSLKKPPPAAPEEPFFWPGSKFEIIFIFRALFYGCRKVAKRPIVTGLEAIDAELNSTLGSLRKSAANATGSGSKIGRKLETRKK